MIDFAKPFQRGFDHTALMLFKPFRAGKWFSLGFTAWLAFLSGNGSGFNYSGGNNYNGSSHSGNPGVEKGVSTFFAKMLDLGLPFWMMVLCLIALLICLLTLIFIALGCRGQFMFLDNVLHNRDEVVKPWKEFSRQANELTLWHCLFSLLPLFVIFGFLGLALLHFWPDLLAHHAPSFRSFLPWILGFVGIILLFFPLALFIFFLHDFGVPIMAKHRCSLPIACQHLWQLLCRHFPDCLLYLIIRFGMGICFFVLSLMTGCCTCCLGFLPYLNAVVTLPYHVFRQSFTLDCLAQFGPDYDLWPDPTPPPFLPSS